MSEPMTFREWLGDYVRLDKYDTPIEDYEDCWNAATAAERERCARTCDEVEQSWIDEAAAVSANRRLSGEYMNYAAIAGGCAAAIREEAGDE